MFKATMEKLHRIPLVFFGVTALCCLSCFADTFKHRRSGEVLHGYATSLTEGGQTFVHTDEKGRAKLNLAEWEVSPDRLGRNNKVIVFAVDGDIMYEIETAAFEQAVVAAADDGPLFILLEIDTPGGRTDFVQRMCAAVTGLGNCQVIAFAKGGEHGGAISAGAAAALACDKIYMAGNTSIGAATVIAISEKGPEDITTKYGGAVGEKFSSAWQAYLASLAEQNSRPGLLARAMIDKDIEVIEVSEAQPVLGKDGKAADRTGGRLFVEPFNKRPNQRLVRTWSRKGSLLTLTGTEAVKCGIADGIVNSRHELLRKLDAAEAEVVIDNQVQKARTELERARGQLNRIRKSVDLKIKQSKHRQRVGKVLKILRSAKSEFKTLIKLAKKYPDLNLDVQVLEDELNSIEAEYQRIKRESSRRR
ncbi:MAG: Clp protease/crotonase-like domain-containing protein [Planctomycetota bacterium]|jgi:ClpP class serine protease